MKNKGFFKTAAALLAALVLLGGFSVTAYAGGGEDLTQGTGSWSMELDSYQPVPAQKQAELAGKFHREDDEE